MGSCCVNDKDVNYGADHELLNKQPSDGAQSPKKKPSAISGPYLEQLQNERRGVIKSKEARNAADREKLQQLKSNLGYFEQTAPRDNQYNFKHRKLTAEVDGLQKIIRTREQQIKKLETELAGQST